MRTWMAAYCVALLLAAGEGVFTTAAAWAPSQPEGSAAVVEPLQCTLSGEPTCVRGKLPVLKVELKNLTKAEVVLVGSLDASSCRWRYPHCYYEVTGPDGESAVRPIGRCGNTSTLNEACFVSVPAGGAFDPLGVRADGTPFHIPHQISARTFSAPGKYRLRFVYSTKNDDLAKWSGDRADEVAANEKIQALFKQVPRVEVKSEEFELTVVAPQE